MFAFSPHQKIFLREQFFSQRNWQTKFRSRKRWHSANMKQWGFETKREETEKKPREEISLKLFSHSVRGHRRGLYFPLNVEESNQGAFDIVQRTDLNIRYTGDGGTSMWQLGTFPDLQCTRPILSHEKGKKTENVPKWALFDNIWKN